MVNGITIQNSPQTHLKFDNCVNIQVSDFTTSSPGDSPNTDGIHLQNSQDAVIYRSTLACGNNRLQTYPILFKSYLLQVNSFLIRYH